ncbi:AraC family transcriptional regulator [Clostridium carboxidivorans P7]|uniref:Transcriptional regulator, AraC family n=1 Tax=Clostridium carboxidivorans P7 TaxID=536227 RepID=C6PRU9_9CLOT|nr:GyrI-like domain-containing protein [Clostridium carboxidivorans]AKN30040.1 AraC family transcriptional regulator [Clostridium carboxidivorans P7]EET88001.1 transcriptional regulator, AraC family [Clostridium carboxidivorans P7]EFG89045.1 bacterial transcription activator, effector binding domain protein [Clostridium carboxidivorans P7]
MSEHKCQEEYIRRIHKVQDYIEHHLGQSLSIEELSGAAGFSKYHFSRIFQGMLHEPLAHYVNRIRIERALFLLAHREDKNMTDIAYELGYTDSAVFSRAFKNYYGASPREYRKEYSKNCKDSFLLSEYNKNTAKKEWAGDPFPVTGQITIENLEEKQVGYVRHTGTYETLAKEYINLIQALFDYARKQHLLVDGQNWVLAIYHDNPEFGEESQFRTSLCLTVPEYIQIQEDGILGTMKLEGGLYAVGHFQIQQEQYSDAWNYMYQEWLTGSGYVPRNSYPFEVYRNDPYVSESHIHKVDIYVPVEPILF